MVDTRDLDRMIQFHHEQATRYGHWRIAAHSNDFDHGKWEAHMQTMLMLRQMRVERILAQEYGSLDPENT